MSRPAPELTVSVVIPTHNRCRGLAPVLDALADQGAAEIVVVANACTDDTLAMLEERARRDPRLKALAVAEPGQMRALQAGVEAASGDVVLLLDDDVVAEPGLIAGHARRHDGAEGLVVVGYMPVEPSARRRRGDYPRRLYADDYERACAGYEADPARILRGLWAGNVSLRREDCLRVGLLPGPGMPAGYGYHEDMDFGLRCQEAGLTGAFDRALRARHLYAKTPAEYRRAARNSGATKVAVYAAHPAAFEPLGEDHFENDLSALGRLALRWSRRRWAGGPIRAALAALTALAGPLRLFGLEARAGHLLARIEQQSGALDALDGGRRAPARASRTAVAGLVVSSFLLLFTGLAVSGLGPEVPGPPVREWLGVAEPPLPVPCKFDPDAVRHPEGEPGPGSWRVEARSPSPSPELGAVTIDHEIYLIGGQTPYGAERTIMSFDPSTGEYRRVGSLPVAVDHPVVAAHDGEVIVAGGYEDGAYATAQVWAFSPRTHRTHELAPMQVPRAAAAGAIVGDRLYVAGGVLEFGNDSQPRGSMEFYDFSEDRWRFGPEMPTPRHHFGAAAVDGKVYFAGGREPHDLSLGSFEVFDPASEEWGELAAIPTDSGSPGVTDVHGKVVVTGGGEDGLTIGEGKWVLRTAYAYDTGSGRWARLPDMLKPRHGHAVAAEGGRVYAFRGIPCPDYGRMASAESLAVH